MPMGRLVGFASAESHSLQHDVGLLEGAGILEHTLTQHAAGGGAAPKGRDSHGINVLAGPRLNPRALAGSIPLC